MDLEELNTKVTEFIEKHNMLEKKLNKILSKFDNLELKLDNLELKLKYCTCEVYAPYTEDGECRNCHGYN